MGALHHRSVRIPLYPNEVQRLRLWQWMHDLRTLYNACLEQYFNHLRRPRADRKVFLMPETQTRFISDLCKDPDLEYFSDIPSVVRNAIAFKVGRAIDDWLSGAKGKPRYKKKNRDSISVFTRQPESFKLCGTKRQGKLRFPKIGDIKCNLYRALSPDARPVTCSVSEENGKWWACISYSFEKEVVENQNPPVGIDMGVVNLITDSDGRMVENPRWLKQAQPEIKKLQKSLCRKAKGSTRYRKDKRKLNRLHTVVKHRRENHLHHVSRGYAKNHGMIFMEDLKVNNMSKSAKGTVENPGSHIKQKSGLNRSILDAGWGLLRTMLEYKSILLGSRVVRVDPRNTSRMCYACRFVSAKNRVTQSRFECISCGHVDHADVNAAKNILSRGLASMSLLSEAPLAGRARVRRGVTPSTKNSRSRLNGSQRNVTEMLEIAN